ncbi:hypothetical protein MHO82_11530 [Vibrio sp. Of7-15]|uniref:hypothetical protein n=1 Tax=Vibrio sp. Of7-15 TaxID=2724879 RepID=UPI001EF2CF47|nr:hypothetical protein [Vibrio sp. Of7-15]MCG7497496.1 hypothetical protein [Vibrio sp. Of7-15]
MNAHLGNIIRKSINSLFCIFILLFMNHSYSQTVINVALDTFPPMYEPNGNVGLTADLLKEITHQSGIQFNISSMEWSRAKTELEQSRVDLIGHAALLKEELDTIKVDVLALNISIPVYNAIFSTNPTLIDINPTTATPEKFLQLSQIGTPFGGKEFQSKLLLVPPENFHEARLAGLVKMLSAERINGVSFEFISVITMVQKMNLRGIYYQHYPTSPIQVGYLVRDNKEGRALKKKLDDVINQINLKNLFATYWYYINFHSNGKVPLSH